MIVTLLLTISSLISLTEQYYILTGSNISSPANQDYSIAVGSPLLNAALFKRITASPNDHCDLGFSGFFPIGSFAVGDLLEKDSNGQRFKIIECLAACTSDSPDSPPNIQQITPANSQSDLLSGENVAESDWSVARTYVLSLSVSGVLDGESDFLNATFQGFAYNVLIRVNVSQEKQTCDLFYATSESDKSTGPVQQSASGFAALDVNGANQLALMSGDNKGVAFLLNGTVIYSAANIALTSLTLAPPTDSFRYNIDDWKIFNETVTTEQLYMMRTCSQPSVYPSPECSCNQSFPIFRRWPSFNDENYAGVLCQSVNGGETVRRFSDESFLAQQITDGDLTTYWIASNTTNQTKITIDLGTSYQIFYATLTVQSLSKYLVVTKKRDENAQDETLFVISPDCSLPLPENLPQGAPLHCQDFTRLFHSEPYNKDARIMYLDWTRTILYPDEIIKNQTAFDESVQDGVFEAQTISFHLYDFHIEVVKRFVINEIAVFGSGVCKNGGQLDISSSNMSDSAGGDVSNFRVYTVPNYEQASGYRCLCPRGYKGNRCTDCPHDSYEILGSCMPCNCGVGAKAENCTDGRCGCNTEGAGIKPQLADDKCHPYVHTIDPTFGPIAGGTLLLVEGAWLSSIEYVNLGSNKCYKLHNQTRTATSFYCRTPPVDENIEPVNPVYTTATTPLASFSYRPDPNITIIGRIEVFIQGGVDIPVSGTNLDSISRPKISITVSCKSSGEVIDTLDENCTVTNSEEMTCRCPDFSGVLENDNTRCSNSARRKRETDIYEKFDFNVGFILDGVDTFKRTSDSPWLEESSSLYIRPDPLISEFSESDNIRELQKGETSLEIQGRNLDSGATVKDYKVNIGVGECNSTAVYTNKLICILPATLPAPAPGEDSRPHPDGSGVKIPAVIVAVGNIKVHVGYLAPPSQKAASIFLPVLLGVLAAVLVIVVVVGVVLYRRQKTTKDKAKRQAQHDQRYVAGPHGKFNTDYLSSESMALLQKWVIAQERLECGKTLGQGQFGKVFLGNLETDQGTTETVAVKTIKGDLLRGDDKAVENFLQEAISMTRFDHPNVLSLLGVVIDKNSMPMVLTPLMSKGDLKHVLLNENEEFTIGDLIHLGLQAAAGMAYLSNKKFVHRDLAARNCMVNDEYVIKIADFGMSHDIYQEDYYRVQDQTKPLPVKWMSIESLRSGKYTVQSDVWSYGVLLWELMTRGGSPYPGINNYEIKGYLNMGHRLARPEVCPEQMYELMCACWIVEPEDRPTFAQICRALENFLNANSDYHRESTRRLEGSTYYSFLEGESNPAYENDFESRIKAQVGDYDVAVPVASAPSSPLKENYDTPEEYNTNNNNKAGSPSRLQDIKVACDEGYLAPIKSPELMSDTQGFKFPKVITATREWDLSATPRSKNDCVELQEMRKKLRSVAPESRINEYTT
ncbi:uncharacterized protein [Watersipora subatra]|uniref:uncharacterized protein n=1 Tax=Watersipora subatra TaxID=2589382 RepID=UPI00355C07E3